MPPSTTSRQIHSPVYMGKNREALIVSWYVIEWDSFGGSILTQIPNNTNFDLPFVWNNFITTVMLLNNLIVWFHMDLNVHMNIYYLIKCGKQFSYECPSGFNGQRYNICHAGKITTEYYAK